VNVIPALYSWMPTVAGYGAPTAAARRRGPLRGRLRPSPYTASGPPGTARRPRWRRWRRTPQQPSAPGRPIEMTLIGHPRDWAADRRRLPVLGKGGSLSGCGAVSRRALHGPGGARRASRQYVDPGLVSDNLLGRVLAQLSGMGRDARWPVSTLSPRHRLAGQRRAEADVDLRGVSLSFAPWTVAAPADLAVELGKRDQVAASGGSGLVGWATVRSEERIGR
jgi:hypothetical protein